jgi:hypothetical protein
LNKVDKYRTFEVDVSEDDARWKSFKRYQRRLNHTHGNSIVVLHYSAGIAKDEDIIAGQATEQGSLLIKDGEDPDSFGCLMRVISLILDQAMSQLTEIVSALEQNLPHSPDELLPLVYDELRRLTTYRLAKLPPGQTLHATALVHEAYLRMLGSTMPSQEIVRCA